MRRQHEGYSVRVGIKLTDVAKVVATHLALDSAHPVGAFIRVAYDVDTGGRLI